MHYIALLPKKPILIVVYQQPQIQRAIIKKSKVHKAQRHKEKEVLLLLPKQQNQVLEITVMVVSLLALHLLAGVRLTV